MNICLQEPIETYYILTRIHHLILSQEPELCLKDMLLLDSFSSRNVEFGKQSIDADRTFDRTVRETLQHPFDAPVHIPKLYNSVMGSICNSWNEFIYTYDPLESHKDVKCQEAKGGGIAQLLAVVWISVVTIALDFHKGFYAVKNEPMIKLNFLHSLVQREIRRRQLSGQVIGKAILFSLHPINCVQTIMVGAWWCCMFWTVRLPCLIIKEVSCCAKYCCRLGK